MIGPTNFTRAPLARHFQGSVQAFMATVAARRNKSSTILRPGRQSPTFLLPATTTRSRGWTLVAFYIILPIYILARKMPSSNKIETKKHNRSTAVKPCVRPIKLDEHSPSRVIFITLYYSYVLHLSGGIPYPGWSEGKVIAEVVNGYKMPKPPHVEAVL